MSLEFQESATETFAESKPFQTLKSSFKKKPQDRTDEDLDLISRHIYDLKYFRDMVHKESGRLEFAKGCAKYLKYEYFPKGMEVLRKGDRGEHFYIILSGEAYVYIPKSEAEIQQEMNEDKQRVFEKYTEFLSQVDQPPNNNMLLSQLSQLPGATSRKSSVNGRSKSVAYSTQTTATIPAPAHFNFNVRKQESATKTLLAGNNKILKPEDMKYDLTYQEKLLFLNNKPVIPGYFDQGIATFKKVNCLRTGDSFGELALIFNQPRLASIIASEDLHLLSFTSYDYKEVFESEIQNVVEKIEFFNGIFPSLSSAHIGRFCYLLEEKTFKFNDIIYKEGDLADGIYIIRQGEVQLSQMTKQNAQDSPRAIGAKRGSITKRKIAAATLVTGNFFGDIETLNNCKRNYTAISVSTTFVYRLKKQAYHGIIAPHFPAIANFLKNQAESTEVTRQNRMEHTKKIQLLALPSFDRINPEPVQKLPEDIKENRMKGIATGRRKSEIFPLHFKARLDTIVLKEQDDEYVNHDLEKDLSIIPQAIEHVQLQSRPSLFDFKDSKVFALVSPREIIKPEQSILTPLSFPRRPSEISNCPSPWFPTPAKIPRLTISGCGSPENKTTNHGSSTAANTTSSRKFLPQLTKSRGSFSGLDIEKIADFGFSGLVNKLKRMPSVSQNNPSLPSSPKKHLTGGNSPTRQIINNMEEIPSMEHVDTPKENSPTTRKETDSPFNKTLAQLIKDKMEHKTTTSSPKTERVNFHVRTKMSKLPFKQMKSPSPDKSVPKTTRELAPLNISHGWKTDRTKNTDVTIMSGYKTEEKKLLQSPTFKKSVPVIDVAKIKRVEHDNVVKNEVLSARSVDARLRKTTHSMFRVFKQSIYK